MKTWAKDKPQKEADTDKILAVLGVAMVISSVDHQVIRMDRYCC
jgi:hypothetical protein